MVRRPCNEAICRQGDQEKLCVYARISVMSFLKAELPAILSFWPLHGLRLVAPPCDCFLNKPSGAGLTLNKVTWPRLKERTIELRPVNTFMPQRQTSGREDYLLVAFAR